MMTFPTHATTLQPEQDKNKFNLEHSTKQGKKHNNYKLFNYKELWLAMGLV